MKLQNGQHRGKAEMGRRRTKSELEPSRKPTRDDLMFVAGFYEGEGCAYRNVKNRPNVQVCIGQKDPEILYRLRDLFGGGIYIRQKTGANKITLYAWMINGKRAVEFLHRIYPHLSSRRRVQIMEAIKPSESVTTVRSAFPIGIEDPVWSAWEHAEADGNDQLLQ